MTDYNAAIQRFHDAGLSVLGEGVHRIVFDRGDGMAIKVPKTFQGEVRNKTEVRRSTVGTRMYVPCACVIVAMHGIDVLFMEKLQPINRDCPPTDLPPWAITYAFGKVGYSTGGALYAYSYADGRHI